jgi:hypothetical protein
MLAPALEPAPPDAEPYSTPIQLTDDRPGGCPRFYLGRSTQRLMLVPEDIRESTAFICIREPSGCKPIGTGFLVVAHHPDRLHFHQSVHLVTANHVIQDARAHAPEDLWLRLNTRGGPFEDCDISALRWVVHPADKLADVAVSEPITLDWDRFNGKALPVEMAATPRVIIEEAIGPGDEVFFVGLFTRHMGQRRILPIIRTGNIALMSEEPLPERNGMKEAFLIEARSLGGLSGSPVFVHLPPTAPLQKEHAFAKAHKLFWLGFIHGHWDEIGIHQEEINMGIAIVEPVVKVLDTINCPDMLELRRAFFAELDSRNAPKQD